MLNNDIIDYQAKRRRSKAERRNLSRDRSRHESPEPIVANEY